MNESNFQVLSKDESNKNVVVSPASIKALLALLVEGAEGDTGDEILQTLQIKQVGKQANIHLLRKLQSIIRVSVNFKSSIAPVSKL